LGNKAKSQGAKSSEQGGWGTITMLLVTNCAVSWTCEWACCHGEGASCGWARVPGFFIAHFLSSVLKRHSKSQSWL
jgi:hypothetical protein